MSVRCKSRFGALLGAAVIVVAGLTASATPASAATLPVPLHIDKAARCDAGTGTWSVGWQVSATAGGFTTGNQIVDPINNVVVLDRPIGSQGRLGFGETSPGTATAAAVTVPARFDGLSRTDMYQGFLSFGRTCEKQTLPACVQSAEYTESYDRVSGTQTFTLVGAPPCAPRLVSLESLAHDDFNNTWPIEVGDIGEYLFPTTSYSVMQVGVLPCAGKVRLGHYDASLAVEYTTLDTVATGICVAPSVTTRNNCDGSMTVTFRNGAAAAMPVVFTLSNNTPGATPYPVTPGEYTLVTVPRAYLDAHNGYLFPYANQSDYLGSFHWQSEVCFPTPQRSSRIDNTTPRRPSLPSSSNRPIPRR